MASPRTQTIYSGHLDWTRSRMSKTRYLARQQAVAMSLWYIVRSWHFLLNPNAPSLPGPAARELLRRLRELLKRDLENVERGYYPLSLLNVPLISRMAHLLPAGVQEMGKVLLRRRRGGHHELPTVANPDHYPDYYLQNFHWQTDGWLSRKSAQIYDLGVEFIFLGTADIMRRMVIPPVVDALAQHHKPQILDIACGTGRSLLQLHQTLPHAELTGLDLSPHYLKEAQEVLREVYPLSLVCGNAEKSKWAPKTFDAITCVFLFHELPRKARRNVMKEAYRLLKPGGVFVVCDAGQAKDNESFEYFIDLFPRLYHEPYYRGYINDPLEAALEQSKFQLISAENQLFSKVVVCRRA